MVDVDNVEQFKQRVKELIKVCKLKDADSFVSTKYESAQFAELELRERVTFVHWWTKVFYKKGDLMKLTARCMTKVNTMINTILTSAQSSFKQADGTTLMTELEVDQCLAELCYLKRAIDTQIQYKDAERALKLFEGHLLSKPENKSDLLIMKYYVKSLLKYDEYQLGVEAKFGYQQLQKAEKLNDEVLIAQHQHEKETVRILINKVQKFKQFMDLETFQRLADSALATIRQPEVIQIMRALAMKYSDLGDFGKALEYIGRAEKLAEELLPIKEHE